MNRLFPVAGLFVLLSIALLVGLLWTPDRNAAPDFTQYPAGEARKTAFFDYLLPLVRAENEAILSSRRALGRIIESGGMGWAERLWLERLAETYEMSDFDPGAPAERQELLRRVDVVPPSLTLAQAANESAWGTSRFALEGNNYFGQWCFVRGCGLVPAARGADATHEVAAFESPRESVRRYMNNINTHNAYQALRRMRASMRAEGQDITGLALATALVRYSERGQEYVDELQAMIRGNDLQQLDRQPDGSTG